MKCPLKLVLKADDIVTDFIRGKKWKKLIWSADFVPDTVVKNCQHLRPAAYEIDLKKKFRGVSETNIRHG